MPRLKTSEGFSDYIRYTRARDVDNGKGLQRSSDENLSAARWSAMLRCGEGTTRSPKEHISSPLWPFLTHPKQDRPGTIDKIDMGRREVTV